MPPGGVYLEKEFLQSPAVKAIKSAHSFRVLLEFYRRRQIHKPKDRRNKHSNPIVLNNGKIELPYRYAKERMKIPQTTFSRCLDEMVNLGFLDLAELSCGLHRQPTKWTISDRWKKYGQPDFESVQRERIIPPFARQRKSQLPPAGNSTG
jgi:hypothetical protein